MLDLEVLKQQEAGLNAKLLDLREDEKAFLSIQGIEKQIIKAANDNNKLDEAMQGIKEEIGELQYKKAAAMAATSGAMAEKFAVVLPEGEAFFDVEGGKVLIGLVLDGVRIPYAGLSGGQKAMFDAAIANAMMGEAKDKLVILEAAEVDELNFIKLLEKVQADESGTQYIINHWLDPGFDYHEDWNIVRLPENPVPGEQVKIF